LRAFGALWLFGKSCLHDHDLQDATKQLLQEVFIIRVLDRLLIERRLLQTECIILADELIE
jgi:hypothetical protein